MKNEVHNEVQNENFESIQKLEKLIDGIQVAMLTSLDSRGHPHTRPMATLPAQGNGTLCFFTREHSAKVAETAQDHSVTVSYADSDKNRYVCLTGCANVTPDKDKMKELWNPLFKAWFPEGLDDPELALMKVDVESAEYWDSPSSTMVKVVGFAKAILTGKPYEGVNHGTLNVSI